MRDFKLGPKGAWWVGPVGLVGLGMGVKKKNPFS